jgi:hypothetical protein
MTFRSKSLVLVAIAAFSPLGMAFPVLAQEKAVPAHAHEDGHDLDAMKAEKKIIDSLAKLSAGDSKLAAAQRFCPVMEYGRLGAMGTPIKLMLEGKPVFVCCKGCVSDASKDAKATLAKAQKLTAASVELAKLSPEDRAAAEAQKYCAIAAGSFLGGMGAPIKLELDGKPVFLCCKGCVAKAQANPAATLKKVEELQQAGSDGEEQDGDHKKN